MTLVPIIYTSLIIFSAVLFLVIVASYLSYKTKSRGKFPPYYQGVTTPVYINPVTPVKKQFTYKIANPLNVRIAPATAPSNQNKSLMQNTQMIKRDEYNPKQKNQINDSRKYAPYNEIENNNTKRFGRNSSSHQAGQQTRIEIMNNSEKFLSKQTSYHPNEVERRNYNRGLGEMNVLNYYSDNTDSSFMRLTAVDLSRAV